MFLSDIIYQSSKAALQLQSEDGSFPPGCNGPYNDPETPARNTAHWLITMLKAYEISDSAKFQDSARRAVQYLLSPALRPMNATFFSRMNPEKDFCNGLMGQAWIIEALAVAGSKLDDDLPIELAKKLFMLHPFDHSAGLWRRVNVDGSYNSFDMTFNHQLWFAAAGSLLGNGSDNSVDSMILRFLDCVSASHLRTGSRGRITHVIEKPPPKVNRLRKTINSLRNAYRPHKIDHYMISKELGYHAFNMHAFAMLKQHIPDHPFWKSNKFLLALNFMNSEEFIKGLDNNAFGYNYNLSGFEVAFAIQEFSSLTNFLKSQEWWVEQQLRVSYDTEAKMLNRSTADKETLSARLYEATCLKDMEVQIN